VIFVLGVLRVKEIALLMQFIWKNKRDVVVYGMWCLKIRMGVVNFVTLLIPS
jgi:hypothetical protein